MPLPQGRNTPQKLGGNYGMPDKSPPTHAVKTRRVRENIR